MVFLKIYQNSQENTCTGVLQYETLFKKKAPVQVFSCKFCEIFKHTYFVEHLRYFVEHLRTAAVLSYQLSVVSYQLSLTSDQLWAAFPLQAFYYDAFIRQEVVSM